MTALEKLKIEHPDRVNELAFGGAFGCPHEYGYLSKPDYCSARLCGNCWSRRIPEPKNLYEIKTKTFNPDDYNYESPITVAMQQITYNIMQEQEKYILEQVHNCGVTVNKEELVKALAYDRDQYNKGFEDGREWVSAKIYAAYKALLDGFTDEAIGYLGELLDDHKEVNEE